jgi:CheY-like chemotaxis protein
MHSILQVGNDSKLLSTRGSVLRQTGASVTAVSGDEAMGILCRESFHLVVFCHTISQLERGMISLVPRQRHADMRVLHVLLLSTISPALNEAVADPVHLLEKVFEALHIAPNEQEGPRRKQSDNKDRRIISAKRQGRTRVSSLRNG